MNHVCATAIDTAANEYERDCDRCLAVAARDLLHTIDCEGEPCNVTQCDACSTWVNECEGHAARTPHGEGWFCFRCTHTTPEYRAPEF